ISVLQILNDFNLVKSLNALYQKLPLADIQLSWLLPFIILLVVGLIIDLLKRNTEKPS
ncbi:branched-chain amino acid transport system II carrier protein, partial [Staphylococcus xylosus]